MTVGYRGQGLNPDQGVVVRGASAHIERAHMRRP